MWSLNEKTRHWTNTKFKTSNLTYSWACRQFCRHSLVFTYGALNSNATVLTESLDQRLYRRDRLPRAFLVVVIWPISEFYGAFVSIMHYFDQSATLQLANVFLIAGVWVSVDFDSYYKILWGETRDHGVPIHERKKKVQNKNLHNYSKMSSPYNIRLKRKLLGWRGRLTQCFLADCSK